MHRSGTALYSEHVARKRYPCDSISCEFDRTLGVEGGWILPGYRYVRGVMPPGRFDLGNDHWMLSRCHVECIETADDRLRRLGLVA